MKYSQPFGFIILSIILGCQSPVRPSRPVADLSDSPRVSFQPRDAGMPELIATPTDTFYSIVATFFEGKPEYFEDIDQLEGKYPISQLSYPCVEIRDLGERRIVTYHVDSIYRNTFLFKKEKTHWLAKYFSRGDTCKYYYTLEYVLPNEVVSFEYSNKECTRFDYMTTYSKNKKEAFIFDKNMSLLPKLSNVSLLKDKSLSRLETKVFESDGLRKVQTVFIDNAGKDIRQTKCYPITSKKYSFIWWDLFASRVHNNLCGR